MWGTLKQGDRPAGVHEASALITNVPAVLLFACVMARQDDDRVIQAS
ncbi:MAG: hypothetical protein WCS87_06985 [Methylococcaceae bacterium]